MAAQVRCISETVANAFPEDWYDIADSGHFWFAGRLAAFLNQLSAVGVSRTETLRGLDIGCGHGVLRHEVETRSAWVVDGCDISMRALSANEPGRGEVFFYNIHDRVSEFANLYDFILLFDILEHIDDTRQFLESALFHLKPGGWLFVNVPAIGALSSRYDEVVGHLRRYDPQMLHQAFNLDGLEVKDIRYWGFGLLPLAVLRKLATRHNTSSADVVRIGFKPPGTLVNGLLRQIMQIETSLLKRPVLGTSLLAAVRKTGR